MVCMTGNDFQLTKFVFINWIAIEENLNKITRHRKERKKKIKEAENEIRRGN